MINAVVTSIPVSELKVGMLLAKPGNKTERVETISMPWKNLNRLVNGVYIYDKCGFVEIAQ